VTIQVPETTTRCPVNRGDETETGQGRRDSINNKQRRTRGMRRNEEKRITGRRSEITGHETDLDRGVATAVYSFKNTVRKKK